MNGALNLLRPYTFHGVQWDNFTVSHLERRMPVFVSSGVFIRSSMNHSIQYGLFIRNICPQTGDMRKFLDPSLNKHKCVEFYVGHYVNVDRIVDKVVPVKICIGFDGRRYTCVSIMISLPGFMHPWYIPMVRSSFKHQHLLEVMAVVI